MKTLQRVFIVVVVTVMLLLTQLSPSFAQQLPPSSAKEISAAQRLILDECKNLQPVTIKPFSDFREPVQYVFDKDGTEAEPAVTRKLDVSVVKFEIGEGGQRLCLRSYISYAPAQPLSKALPKANAAELVGPTIITYPGKRISLQLTNNLPNEDSLDPKKRTNTTNFHSHGLHVSPDGISDNVLREMEPDDTTPYDIVIDVPSIQPGGTDWYHPHVHGMTAVQVSNGMEGALIVKDGALDQVKFLQGLKERILVLQQIPYNNEGTVEPKDTDNTVGANGQTILGGIDRGTWINGQIQPTIRMYTGEVERWRLIDAGERESIHVELRKEGSTPVSQEEINQKVQLLASELGQDEEKSNVDKEVLENNVPKGELKEPQLLHEIAVDGMPLGKLDSWTDLDLEPGYRSDVLVQLRKPGTYWLIDEKSKASENISLTAKPEKILAKVVVEDRLDQSSATGDPQWRKTDWYKTEPTGDGIVFRQELLKSLADALKNEPLLTKIEESEYEYTPTIKVTFDIPDISTAPRFTVNGNVFKFDETASNVSVQPDPISVKVTPWTEWQQMVTKEGTANEWILKSKWHNHPFHIHVNPFQVYRKGPNSDIRNELVWKDTLLVEGPYEVGEPIPQPISIYSRYIEYTGCSMLHCHILPHEDRGMMSLVKYTNQTGTLTNEQCYKQTQVGHKEGTYKP